MLIGRPNLTVYLKAKFMHQENQIYAPTIKITIDIGQ